MLNSLLGKGVEIEPLRPREARWLGRSAWTRARRFFYAVASTRMTTTGLPSCSHARDHVGGAWGLPIPERDEHVACLRHLVIAAHAGDFSQSAPSPRERARA